MADSYIKQGDCLELMKEIPDGSVDMILADPPYGITRNKWDSVIPLDEMWTEYHRIIKPNGAIVLNCAQPFTSALIMSNPSEFKYLWYWDKHAKTGFLNAKKQPLRQVEEIAVFYRKQCLFHPPKKKREKTFRQRAGKSSSTCYAAQNRNYITITDTYCATTLISDFPKRSAMSGHPTQKPIDLLEYLIKTYTDPGEVVLDNCMGSGSTCVAAVNTGRKYIGFELNEEYFKTAEERIREALEEL